MLPQYGTVMKRGVLYYRTRIKDTNGKLVAIYAKTILTHFIFLPLLAYFQKAFQLSDL